MVSERAVSSVIGVVMILAITVAAITSIMVIGAVALQSTQDETDLSQMETAMAEMSSKVSQVALGDSNSQAFDFGGQAKDSMQIDENAGNVSILVDGNEIYSGSLGVLTYEKDGSTVAFQGGGVWKSQNGNGGEMISPPEFHYQDATLTFPIIRTTAGESQASSSGSIVTGESNTIFPNESYANPLDDQNATVEISSDYHRGWYQFFESRTTGEVDHYPEDQRVIVDLIEPFDNEIRSGLALASNDPGGQDAGPGAFDPEPEYDQDLRTADQLIQDKLNECDSNYEDYEEGMTFENETYCFDENIILEGNNFDTNVNEISIVVDGAVSIDQTDTNVTNPENSVYFYSTENLYFLAESDPGEFDVTFYGEETNEFVFILNSSSSNIDIRYDDNHGAGYGIIYAPDSVVKFGTQSDFYGTIAAYDVQTRSGPTPTVKMDEDLDMFPIDIDEISDLINYLHITENTVEFEFD